MKMQVNRETFHQMMRALCGEKTEALTQSMSEAMRETAHRFAHASAIAKDAPVEVEF